MSRCKCDWSAEHTADEFKRITPITHKEEERIEAMFRTYLIVEVWDRRTKNFYCTSCGHSSPFVKPRSILEPDWDPYSTFEDYYSMKHGDQTTCPFCGKSAEVVYAGKMGSRCEKMWQQVQVVVFHAEDDGWLSAQAVHAVKNYSGKEWDTQVDFFNRAQYLFRPGCVLQRVYEIRCTGTRWKRIWDETKTVYEPFRPGMNYWTDHDVRDYDEIGLEECLGKTDMRYSAADIFVSDRESDFGLMRYLGEYCHRPQLEMLTKLGLDDILRELIYCHRSNVRRLNWNATDLPGFLRLDKRHTKLFMQSKHRSIQELETAQMLRREGCRDQEMLETSMYLADLRIETIRQLHEAAGNRTITEVVRYLRKQKSRDAAQLWIDYIRMATDLEYDLDEETVFFPKDLQARHDAAAQTIKLKQSEIQMKKYKRRYKKLCRMYEFMDGEFAIVVPPTPEAIISEGKALHHCVGGYVNRHVDGTTTILFLRKAEQLEQPYGTIEMSVTNVSNMIQLRGYRNNDTPREESEQFVAKWRAWIKAGSPRDPKGNPIIKTEIETRVRVTA